MIKFCKLLDASNGHLDRHLPISEVSEFCEIDGKVIWIDVQDPTEEDLATLHEELGFHHLALEDCAKAHSRPKLEKYPGYVFLVLYELSVRGLDNKYKHTELNVFLGKTYVVTVHRGPATVIDEVGPRWEAATQGDVGGEGPSFLAYMLIDAAVDSYFPVLDAFSDKLEILEDIIFSGSTENVVEDIFRLKKQTLAMRRIVTPLRDVFLTLLRRDEQLFGPQTYLYFQDVLDHLLRVSDSIDNYRDLVNSAVDAYMTNVSNRTNETMKVLTVASTVLMIPTIVSGIYGMNFEHMPELHWLYGYPSSIVVMLVLMGTALGLFRWRGYI